MFKFNLNLPSSQTEAYMVLMCKKPNMSLCHIDTNTDNDRTLYKILQP